MALTLSASSLFSPGRRLYEWKQIDPKTKREYKSAGEWQGAMLRMIAHPKNTAAGLKAAYKINLPFITTIREAGFDAETEEVLDAFQERGVG